jgi:hypothetical protein
MITRRQRHLRTAAPLLVVAFLLGFLAPDALPWTGVRL